MPPPWNSPLLTDLYQLTMLQAYLEHGMTETAVFEFFVRKLPPRRGFLVAAGLEQVVDYLEGLRFGDEEIAYLEHSGRFPAHLLDWLRDFRFTGDVDALPEGTVFFADEPAVRVTAPLPQAQLVETRIVNLVHFSTLIASKAARMVLAAPGKRLVDFGLRRAHGAEAGLLAARSAYLAGFAGSATTLAEPLFGVPAFGTMAHSFVQAHDDEEEAFLRFARARPQGLVLLIDTYDTEAAAAKVARLTHRLRREGIVVKGVRLDSGDLADHAVKVRRILDGGGLKDVTIFASGGLDEDVLAEHARRGIPIDGYGIGTSLTTSTDVAAFDCAYKLQEYAGVARRKRSEGKATWPGRKQVWRRLSPDGRMAGDLLGLVGESHDGETLVRPAMRNGRRVAGLPTLPEARARAAAELARLPEALRRLSPPSYAVKVSPALAALAAECDRRQAATANMGETVP
jgi:nicotinate phosphoribosyltransferase